MHLSGGSTQEGSPSPMLGASPRHLHPAHRSLLLPRVPAMLSSTLRAWGVGETQHGSCPNRLAPAPGTPGSACLPCALHWEAPTPFHCPRSTPHPMACLLLPSRDTSHYTLPVLSPGLFPQLWPPLPRCILGTGGLGEVGCPSLRPVPRGSPDCTLDVTSKGFYHVGAIASAPKAYRLGVGGMHSGKHSGAVDLGQTLKNTFIFFSNMHPKQFALHDTGRPCLRKTRLCCVLPRISYENSFITAPEIRVTDKLPAALCPTAARGEVAATLQMYSSPACAVHGAPCSQDAIFPRIQFLGLASSFRPHVVDTARFRVLAVSDITEKALR